MVPARSGAGERHPSQIRRWVTRAGPPSNRRPSSGTTSRSLGQKTSTDPPSVSAGISMPKSSPVISPGHCWFIPLDASFPSPAWLLIFAMIFARDGYSRREILDAGIKVDNSMSSSNGQIALVLIHGFIIGSYVAMIPRRMASAHHDQLIGDILGTVLVVLSSIIKKGKIVRKMGPKTCA